MQVSQHKKLKCGSAVETPTHFSITKKKETRSSQPTAENKEKYLHRKVTNGSKEFWKTVRQCRKSETSQIQTLKSSSGTMISASIDKASFPNDVLAQNFNSGVDPLSTSNILLFTPDASKKQTFCVQLRN